jgi:hypothetical protein
VLEAAYVVASPPPAFDITPQSGCWAHERAKSMARSALTSVLTGVVVSVFHSRTNTTRLFIDQILHS